jgi:hypothetical protein
MEGFFCIPGAAVETAPTSYQVALRRLFKPAKAGFVIVAAISIAASDKGFVFPHGCGS